MEYIGNRISVIKNEKELSVVVLSYKDSTKQWLLTCWLLGWTACGMIFLSQFFGMQNENTKIGILVMLAFWAYFEFMGIKAFMWRKFGKEKIKIKEGKLFVKRDIRGHGKKESFGIEFIKDIRLCEQNEKNFWWFMSRSYWTLAGETIAFDYYGREKRMAMELDLKEAKELLKLIKQYAS